MMKKYFLYITIFFISALAVFAQTNELDTMALAKIESVLLTDYNSVEFDITVTRVSDNWRYVANGTFQLVFANAGAIDYRKVKLEYVLGSSELLDVSSGLPDYDLRADVLDDRIQIIVLGPKDYDKTKKAPFPGKLRIGRFKIYTTDGSKISEFLDWKKPSNYYQALAFKYSDEDPKPEFLEEPRINDNIEIANEEMYKTIYSSDANIIPSTIVRYFNVEYAGNLQVVCNFGTQSEYKTMGYEIMRGLLPANEIDIESLDNSVFTDTVATYLSGPYSDKMKAAFTSLYPQNYGPIPNELPYRGIGFVYRLFYHQSNGEILKVGTRLINVPNAVIEAATAFPNPFKTKTEIEYILSDRVSISAIAFDALGREIKKLTDEKNVLIDNVEKEKGKHKVIFYAPELASQGLYNVVLIAHPINDPSIEISRAVVKVRLVKD